MTRKPRVTVKIVVESADDGEMERDSASVRLATLEPGDSTLGIAIGCCVKRLGLSLPTLALAQAFITAQEDEEPHSNPEVEKLLQAIYRAAQLLTRDRMND